MTGVMLPVVIVAVDIVNVVAVEIVIVINVDVAAAPVAIPPPVIGDTRADEDTGAKGQPHSGIVSRIGVGVVRISRWPINDCRIVRGHVDRLRVSLFDNDNVLVVPG